MEKVEAPSAPASDPLAMFRGKTFELTAFERKATSEQLERITKAQNQLLTEAAVQVLVRSGLPRESAKGIPCRFRIVGGELLSVEVLEAKAQPPRTPATKKPEAKKLEPKAKPRARAGKK